MTKRVQLVRDDNAGSQLFLGKLGEITINTGNKSIHVHDNVNAGGTEQARADLVNVAVATSGNAGKMSAQQASELAQALLAIVTNTTNIASNDVDIAANLAAIAANDIDIGNLQATQVTKADKVIPATVGNVATLNAAGNLVDGLKTIAELLARANHTGTQLMATISDAGALATLNSVSAAEIDANAVDTSQIAASAVTQAEIAASAVGQGELKTALQSTSTTSTAVVVVAATGGQYNFNQRGRISAVGVDTAQAEEYMGLLGQTSFASYFGIAVTGGGKTAYLEDRYVQASPPYDLGDGLIGEFIFVIIDNASGEVETIYSAPEAPWHNNGPTDITGKIDKQGRKWRERKDMSGYNKTLAQAKLNPIHLAEYAAAFKAAPVIMEEITQTIKNADMNLIPHPFIENSLVGKTVVMLDPVSDLNHQLSEMKATYDEFDLNGLFHDGFLTIGNKPLVRKGPAGLLIPEFKWKTTP